MGYSPQLKRVLARIEGIPDAVRRDMQPAIVKSGEELAGVMKHLAEPSRDTGALIESIEVTPPGGTTPPYSQPGGSRTAHELEAVVTVGNSEVRYPHLVEYGTAHAPAQPFFWPAVRTLQKRINNRLNRTAGKAVREWWSKQ
ncbi:HK97-gp10 family putative phage morphogenesis protein [Devosia sp. RR2S18]|uniref:HK97-gp10 family putative phage morphogenesis protein n=1 Tax=Devosia rhizosphaerae TaxID=3049774 RepID=UPI002541050C|nr:HK97-gp10 family putative phage morphogenesis protein [Devosia sp. RR2S18]WIJ24230.1 HK97 gp10 family phage protein [Devosia sp. RR2S18]